MVREKHAFLFFRGKMGFFFFFSSCKLHVSYAEAMVVCLTGESQVSCV